MNKICDILIKEEKTKITLFVQDYSLILANTESNRKVIIIISKLFKSQIDSKRGITFQEISTNFKHNDRQWSNNFHRNFCEFGDFLLYLKRVSNLKEKIFPLVEEHFLNNIMLNENQRYELFLSTYSKIKISKGTYSEYINRIDSKKIIRKIKQLFTKGEININTKYYIEKLLNMSNLKTNDKKEINELLNISKDKDISKDKKVKTEIPLKTTEKYILVALFYACGMSQDIIAILFGVCKTTIHNWLYRLCSINMEQLLLSKIKNWSGKICVDEKWVKIKGDWNYILSAVDQVTGFPLLIELHSTIDTDSWKVFFKKFNTIYGKPTLIISDGSRSLKAGKAFVFPKVCHQLCNFHKYRNLLKRIYQYCKHDPQLKRYFVLAKGIFCNKSVSARKYAAKKLCDLSCSQIKKYVNINILGDWRKLSKGITSNAVERFNRKLNKVISVRYGIKSKESMQVIIRSLWLKEIMFFGKKHLSAMDDLNNIKISKLCQKNINFSDTIHFLKNNKGFHIDIA